jgi:hypothetical protein
MKALCRNLSGVAVRGGSVVDGTGCFAVSVVVLLAGEIFLLRFFVR